MNKTKWPWDKVYVINLDSEKRMKLIDKELKRLNIKYTRISATNGFEKFPYGKEVKKLKLYMKSGLILIK